MNLVLNRARIPAAVAIVLGSLAAGFVAFHGRAVPVGALFLAAVSLAAGGAVAVVHLRHWLLAVAAVLAPLPGLLALGPLLDGLPMSGLLAAYGCGAVVAGLAGANLVRKVLDGTDRAAAAGDALRALALPVTAGTLLAAALEFAWLFHAGPGIAVVAAGAVAAAMLPAGAAVVLIALVLPFGESFFTAANRQRERREAWLRRLTVVTEPRWGMSLTGVAMVLAVLGWFGAAPMLPHSAVRLSLLVPAGSAVGLFAVVQAVGRDWRWAAAAMLGAAVLFLVSLWLWSWTVGRLVPSTLIEIAAVVSAAATGALAIAAGARRFQTDGDGAVLARQRALEQWAVPLCYAALGAAAAIAPWFLLHGAIATLALLFLIAAGTAVLIVPAIATALETLAPRRRSLRELYGRG